MASWAEDMERSVAYDETLRAEPGFVPDPKPPPRIVSSDYTTWAETLDMMEKGCQVCGEQAGGLSVHHIVPRSQGGDDVIANFAVLCGHGTVGCHGDVEARRNGARERLRENMTAAQWEYVVAKKGDAWVARHYPIAGTV